MELFEQVFVQFIAAAYPPSNPLAEVIEYILTSKGKRVRARLALLACKSMGGDMRQAFCAAIAIEMIHAYSLVHDDLPCMDNDDLRRGLPTAHIKFGEAKAILAADAILTDAFQLLANENFCPNINSSSLKAEQRLKLIEELSKASGSEGMVLGQTLDLYWTAQKNANLKTLDHIHHKKTGHLIAAACSMGGICANASKHDTDALRSFGEKIGLAFQIVDDCLDSKEGLGKTAGKDLRDDKLSYLKLMSEPEAFLRAAEQTKAALSCLEPVSKHANLDELTNFAHQLLDRNN